MNIDNIKSLAEILVAGGLTALEVCDGDAKIRLEKTVAVAAASVQAAAPSNAPVPESSLLGGSFPVNFDDISDITSPIVGIFYSSPTPDAPPFVTIGSRVKKGDVLCIIEAMKQMNEIAAETDGEIADICIKNGDIAEFGQVLFKLF